MFIDKNMPFWYDLIWLYLKEGKYELRHFIFNQLQIDANLFVQHNVKELCLQKMKYLPFTEREKIFQKVNSKFEQEVLQITRDYKLFYPMTPEQVRDCALNHHIHFGGHTHTHTILSVPGNKDAELDLRTNKDMIEKIAGKPCVFFAYPNGSAEDFFAEHKKILKVLGYQAAFSLTQRRCNPKLDPMEISRFNISPEDTLPALKYRFSGMSNILKNTNA